jgi:hypothetical protein
MVDLEGIARMSEDPRWYILLVMVEYGKGSK